jgi:hypothetical protein
MSHTPHNGFLLLLPFKKSYGKKVNRLWGDESKVCKFRDVQN